MRNVDIDYDREFITKMVPKLDWKALVFAAQCVSIHEVTLNKVWYSTDFKG